VIVQVTENDVTIGSSSFVSRIWHPSLKGMAEERLYFSIISSTKLILSCLRSSTNGQGDRKGIVNKFVSPKVSDNKFGPVLRFD
jgi:hypothetical protein